MSGFSKEERAAEAKRRKDADLARDTVRKPDTGEGVECVHCHRTFPPWQGSTAGGTPLCEACLHND